MSNIGMIEEITSHDELTLTRTEGGTGGEIYDCDGDLIYRVSEEHMAAAEKCLPLIVGMFRKGQRVGEGTGRYLAQSAMQKALGL